MVKRAEAEDRGENPSTASTATAIASHLPLHPPLHRRPSRALSRPPARRVAGESWYLYRSVCRRGAWQRTLAKLTGLPSLLGLLCLCDNSSSHPQTVADPPSTKPLHSSTPSSCYPPHAIPACCYPLPPAVAHAPASPPRRRLACPSASPATQSLIPRAALTTPAPSRSNTRPQRPRWRRPSPPPRRLEPESTQSY